MQKLEIPDPIQIFFLVVHVEPAFVFYAPEIVRNLAFAGLNLVVGLS